MQVYREYLKVFCVGATLSFGCGSVLAQQDKNDVAKVIGTFNFQGKDYSQTCLVGRPPDCGDFFDRVKPTDLIALQQQHGLLLKPGDSLSGTAKPVALLRSSGCGSN